MPTQKTERENINAVKRMFANIREKPNFWQVGITI
jgi:hypothetical protein